MLVPWSGTLPGWLQYSVIVTLSLARCRLFPCGSGINHYPADSVIRFGFRFVFLRKPFALLVFLSYHLSWLIMIILCADDFILNSPKWTITRYFSIYTDLFCSHRRVYEFYIATVQNLCSWRAYPCTNFSDFEDGKCTTCNGACPTMGYGADLTKRVGYFYLRTNSALPFCGE